MGPKLQVFENDTVIVSV